MTEKNIIISIFNKSFEDYPILISKASPLLLVELKKIKIDIQDLSLIESISTEDLDEIINKIKNGNQEIVERINNSKTDNGKLYDELVENFLKEIINTVDFVYNLIISKQLGG